MKHAWLYGFGLMLLGIIALGAGPAGAVTSAAGPYYAMPSWDQTMPASTRFIVLTNMSSAAVLDRETGLVWEQSPDGVKTYTWENAQFHCIDLTIGGRDGWRLPTVQELKSLVDRTQSNPSLPSGNPFSSSVQSSFYWSATTAAGFTSLAWVVSFTSGNVNLDDKGGSTYVWCVRGGHGVDPQ
jgi:hypothetical protein